MFGMGDGGVVWPVLRFHKRIYVQSAAAVRTCVCRPKGTAIITTLESDPTQLNMGFVTRGL